MLVEPEFVPGASFQPPIRMSEMKSRSCNQSACRPMLLPQAERMGKADKTLAEAKQGRGLVAVCNLNTVLVQGE